VPKVAQGGAKHILVSALLLQVKYFMIARGIITFIFGRGLIVAAALALAANARAQVVVAQHAVLPQATTPPDTPEERMRRRFPQPVRVGDLIGLRVLDDNDVTIGFVRQVVRAPSGKIVLIVAHSGVLGWGGRLVAVPIEVVAIFGRQLASLDMKPEEYAVAPTWSGAGGQVLAQDEMIAIGLTRR
jgi:hypothetical protein